MNEFKGKINPYEGNGKFIFVSYAHKDSNKVLPIIAHLMNDGYRVWYDDGIAPGSEWPENIAQHLDASHIVIAFVSEHSVASANCRREVTFSLSKNKTFIAVFLEKTEMSLGMEMQLSAQQCVFKYAYKDDEDFYKKLSSLDRFEECRDECTPNMPVKPIRKIKMKYSLLAIPVLLIALVIGLVFYFGKGGNIYTLSDGTEIDLTEGYVTIENEVITDKLLKRIDFKQVGLLSFTNCEIKADLSKYPGMSGLYDLELKDCKIQDFSFLENMPDLVSLNVAGTDFDNEDLKIISQMKILQSLDISCTKVTEINDDISLTQLSDLSIKDLKEVTDIDSLNFLKHLNTLDISGTGISSMEWISQNAESLFELRVAGCSLDDATKEAISKCFNIETLEISNSNVNDLSILGNMRSLSALYATNCNLSDVDILEKKSELTILWLNGNNIQNISIENCSLIEELNLAHNNISDLSHLPQKPEAPYDLKIAIYDNPIDLSTIPIYKDMKKFYVDYDDALLTLDLPEKCEYTILNIPADKMADVNGHFDNPVHNISQKDLDYLFKSTGSL